MAIQTITYTDKVDLNNDSSIAAINKVVAADMNEIKSVVNNNSTTTPTSINQSYKVNPTANEVYSSDLINSSIKSSQTSATHKWYNCDYINDKCDGVVLFESANGETGNIVLSETLNNYKYIEVYFIDNDGTNGPVAKFDNTNNRLNNNWISLEKSFAAYKKTKNFSISGKNLTVSQGSGEAYGTSFTESNNMIKVYKIIGYK